MPQVGEQPSPVRAAEYARGQPAVGARKLEDCRRAPLAQDVGPSALVGRLEESPIGDLSIADRLAIPGETSLIVGNRGGADTFPYGYFKAWTLDTNTGRFDRA